jgi:hypothetical protein
MHDLLAMALDDASMRINGAVFKEVEGLWHWVVQRLLLRNLQKPNCHP